MCSVELQITKQERSLVPSATSLVSAHSARMTVAHFAGAAFLAHSASLASETFRGSVRSIVAEQQVLHRFKALFTTTCIALATRLHRSFCQCGGRLCIHFASNKV